MKSTTKFVLKNNCLNSVLLTVVALFIFAGRVEVSAADKSGTLKKTASGHSKEVQKRQKNYSPYPTPDAGYVSDFARLLSTKEQEVIEKILWQVEKQSKCEIIVVTIYSILDYKGTANGSVESFAAGLFDKYGIGNMPKNDGILLLVAVKDRKVRIELGKYYGRARDAEASQIVKNIIVPAFKKNNYPQGIHDAVVAIVEQFTPLKVRPLWQRLLPVGIIIIAVIVLSMIAYSLFKRGKKGWGWICLGAIFILVLAAIYLVVKIIQAMPKSNSSSWSSGGIGGFGGGSSGGGGATGGW